MKKKQIFLSTALLLLIVNCGGPAKRFSTVENQNQILQKREVSILKKEKELNIDSLTAFDSISTEIDGLISMGLSLCSLSDFNGADSVLVEAIKKVRDYSDNITGDSVLYIDEWLRRIATIYCHNFPDTFTYPDDIATQVIELKINEAIDSLKISKEDSIFLAGFFNKSKVTYDIPMVWNNRVQRALYYYLTHSNSTVKHWGKRMKPYIGFMKKMIIDSGLPSDLSYLPIIESCFNPKALSRSYASGIWQFVKSTGEIYGLRTGYWFDERRDPILST
ncbi:MAG: transglycosylase SLT domain-containing protein, partial [Chitinispirillaceae bacterium]|nr:transglycosylase SLT domain-containing protein [Chitinispirillaceae bacterium]